MTAHIAVQPDGRHACYRVTASGKGRVYDCCDHLTPRDAIRHSDTLEQAATARSAQIIPAAGAFPPEAVSRTSEPSGPPRPAVEDRLPAPVPVTDIRAVAGRPGPTTEQARLGL